MAPGQTGADPTPAQKGSTTKLQGQRTLIAGADSGIGQAAAELFAREGADMAITCNTDAAGGRGKTVIVSSVVRHLPTPESAPYGMSKAGIGSLCRSPSREPAEDKSNVNNVAPGRPARRDRQGDPRPRQRRFRLRHRPHPGGGWRPDHAMGRRLKRPQRGFCQVVGADGALVGAAAGAATEPVRAGSWVRGS